MIPILVKNWLEQAFIITGSSQKCVPEGKKVVIFNKENVKKALFWSFWTYFLQKNTLFELYANNTKFLRH